MEVKLYYSRLSLRYLRDWYRAHPMRPKWAWHRARHGWAPRDVWSFDDYLARLVAEALTHLRDNGVSYFGRSVEEYRARLTRVIEPLEVWGRKWEWDGTVSQEEELRRYHEAQKAFRRVGDMLAHLWD